MIIRYGKGVRDWLLQRLTALLILVYALSLTGYCIVHAPLSYDQWRGLFSQFSIQLLTFLSLLALMWHAWLGMWTVTTDYLPNKSIRLIFQMFIIALLLSSLLWVTWQLWRLIP